MATWGSVVVQILLLVAVILGIRTLRRGLRSIRENLNSMRRDRPAMVDDFVSTKSLFFLQKPRVREILARLGRKEQEDLLNFDSLTAEQIKALVKKRTLDMSYGVNKGFRKLPIALANDVIGKTVLCNVAVGEKFSKSVAGCLESQRRFAEARGLDYVSLTSAPLYFPRPLAWLKILLLIKLLSAGYRRILYIDADAMVTNQNFDFGAVFNALENSGKALTVSEDEDGINSGVIFVQNTQAAFDLLELIWLYDVDITNPTWEQHALKTMMEMSNEVTSKILIEGDQKRFNSFPIERNIPHPTEELHTWSEGDFVCHFSGIRSPHLERYVSNYAVAMANNDRAS